MARFERSKRDSPKGRPSTRKNDSRSKYQKRDFDSFNDRPQRRESSRDKPEMHQVVCASCKKLCEVPFKPTSSKPVYCRDCFSKNENSNSGSSSSTLDEINRKLDKIMRALKIN
jgi:CxxC-x17-CxxC domain-containing protein